jgi:cold shock protein
MPTGTVKWFDVKKGFGFIVNAEGKDVFVHFTSIEGDGFRSLKDGEKVEYEETGGAKGLSAKNVRRLKPARPEIKPAATRMNDAEMDQTAANNTATA